MKLDLPPLPAGYENRMERFSEEKNLALVGKDTQGRDAFLHPAAAQAWLAMKDAAATNGRTFLLVSAFRSMARQEEIMHGKLARGLSWEEILFHSAFPGFSEHHTGRAVDIASPGCSDLVEDFEGTAEYQWLAKNADRFGFVLSYPRNNPHGIAYEPWHWFWRGAI